MVHVNWKEHVDASLHRVHHRERLAVVLQQPNLELTDRWLVDMERRAIVDGVWSKTCLAPCRC